MSTRKEPLFGSNILSRGMYNMGLTRPKPSPEKNPKKKVQHSLYFPIKTDPSHRTDCNTSSQNYIDFVL